MADEPRPMLVVADKQYENRVFAAEYKAALANPIDKARREGGYFLGPNGVPHDAEGRTIPEAEWADEDFERVKGMTRADAEAAAGEDALSEPPTDGAFEDPGPRPPKGKKATQAKGQ